MESDEWKSFKKEIVFTVLPVAIVLVATRMLSGDLSFEELLSLRGVLYLVAVLGAGLIVAYFVVPISRRIKAWFGRRE